MNPRTRTLILTGIALALAVIIAVIFISLADLSSSYSPPQPKPLPEGPQPFVTATADIAPTADGPTPIVQGPPAFRLLVTPVEARARPGDTIVYRLTVEPEGGFNEPVSFRLDIRALFLYQESFDLGTIDPPFPKTIEYRFMVPPEVPSGITVSGILTGDGGEYHDAVSLILIIS